MSNKLNIFLDEIQSENKYDNSLEILKISEKLIENYNEKEIWFKFLNFTYKPNFLLKLENEENRNRWAEIVFKILQKTNYNFNDLMQSRVDEHPNRILFQDMSSHKAVKWTYEQVYNHAKEMAAVFYQSTKYQPKVAIFCQNSVESAICDLSCLMFDIFDTPISTHFNVEILIYIVNILKINIIVVDSKQRLAIVEEAKKSIHHDLQIFTISQEVSQKNNCRLLQEECKNLNKNEIENILSKRKIKKTSQVATTMFTSGSTGQPKGVSFSIYNLVSKRFARSAALPKIGDGEVMICYLPLFHTFGRFLEMMGTIYWNGTYVMVGNTSKETLLKLFPEINPSIFISIPLRWQELYEKCIEATENIVEEEFRLQEIKKVIGQNLKWGLSAAGYLDPKVFKYFQYQGVELCSGFGMTEASGGITMTPPGDYSDDSVGKPLPGIKTKLKENGELMLSGHYVAKYLELAGVEDVIDYPISEEKDYWMSTGDIFIIHKNGHHQIVDRVKDIYKNNKGQTVAPRTVEKKFVGVPGIKSSFLVGDGKPYNVLLIVPDYEDTVLKSSPNEFHNEYFHQIVMQANKDIPNYERVINFSILERDFSQDLGELTPKGSFNRKQIENNFSEIIERLYVSNTVLIETNNFNISIPRWFFRDLAILENDIYFANNYLINRISNKKIQFLKLSEKSFRIGNFIYFIDDKVIDLGIFTRQPKLWLGNIPLVDFCPVKEGWDIALKEVNEQICILDIEEIIINEKQISLIKGLKDNRLNDINKNIALALFSEKENSISSILFLSKLLKKYDRKISDVIRKRLEALSCSKHEEIRTLAYRILLLDDPDQNYNNSFPAFIKSGKTFINQETIDIIAKSNIGKQHLQSLRQRLHLYRTELDLNYNETTVLQLENIFSLLFKYASDKIEYFSAVRAEFASWIVHKKSNLLAKSAEYYFNLLTNEFDKKIEKRLKKYNIVYWEKIINFGQNLTQAEQKKLISIFQSSYFFQKSVILTFNDFDFNMEQISENGLWIIKLLALKNYNHYRISINTRLGKHFDLHLVTSENLSIGANIKNLYLMASISSYPFENPILPALGYNWNEMGLITTQYIGGLTVWEKIREYSEIHKSSEFIRKKNLWKKLFIKAFVVIFKAWKFTGFEIVPGLISANNIVVPELDFKENSTLISITGWKNISQPIDILKDIVYEFYCKTTALYPWSKNEVDINWIFDAIKEAFCENEVEKIFILLKEDFSKNDSFLYDNTELSFYFKNYIEKNCSQSYLPLALDNAISQYHQWEKMNTYATIEAKEQTVFELIDLYKINNYKEVVRYELYRKTIFANKNENIKKSFEILINKMKSDADVLPLQLIELSDLQSSLTDEKDKKVFGKMVFPSILSQQKLDILKIGEKRSEHVIVSSEIYDKMKLKYNFREPVEASEVGLLYQLFFKENFPKEISEMDKHLVMTDFNNQIIGGLCYKILENETVLLDGMVVTSTLQGRGLGSAMIEDFFTRMNTEGIKTVKAHFLFGNYYLKHNFKVDKNWGALVRFL